MTPYHSDPWLTVYQGDCREVMAAMEPASVHCVVTSPPYWGLRDYGISDQLGLEATPEAYVAAMVEVFRAVWRVLRDDGTVWLNLGDSYFGTGRGPSNDHKPAGFHSNVTERGEFPIKGVYTHDLLKSKDLVGIPWRVAFALQADGWYLRSDIIWSKPNPMPESVTDRPTKAHEYLFLLAKGQWKARVVQVSDLPSQRLHLGEDFGAKGSAVSAAGEFAVRFATAITNVTEAQQDLGLRAFDAEVWQERAAHGDGVPIADLPIEHRASVLAARLLSSDIPAKEFLSELHRLGIALSDGDNLRVGGVDAKVPLPPGVSRYGERSVAIHHPGEIREFDFVHNTIITASPTTCTYYFDADAVREGQSEDSFRLSKRIAAPHKMTGQFGAETKMGLHEYEPNLSGRNLRSVWTIATAPYPGAHFATFPPKLVEPCVKAGTSERGVCSECGAPWGREVERGGVALQSGNAWQEGRSAVGHHGPSRAGRFVPDTTTTGWHPSCAHDAPTVPAVVLDPFAGSGTTGMVAQSLGRRAVLIDLNGDYLVQAMARNADIPLGLEIA